MYSRRVRHITESAVIAALYTVFTYLTSLFGLASGVIQVRISEALIALVCFTPSAIPGLFIGCIISNLVTGGVAIDVIFGSLATLIGAILGRLLRNHPYLSPIPTVIANSVIVPFVLRYAYGAEGSLAYFALTVGIGEIISAWILGSLLYILLRKHSSVLFGSEAKESKSSRDR